MVFGFILTVLMYLWKLMQKDNVSINKIWEWLKYRRVYLRYRYKFNSTYKNNFSLHIHCLSFKNLQKNSHNTVSKNLFPKGKVPTKKYKLSVELKLKQSKYISGKKVHCFCTYIKKVQMRHRKLWQQSNNNKNRKKLQKMIELFHHIESILLSCMYLVSNYVEILKIMYQKKE